MDSDVVSINDILTILEIVDGCFLYKLYVTTIQIQLMGFLPQEFLEQNLAKLEIV